MNKDRDYVLGTHDAEIERLGLQHRVWQASTLQFWRRGGITRGQFVVDAGSGPGYAAMDLAGIVGPKGHVAAIERSERFLRALKQMAAARGFANIETIEADLHDDVWPKGVADAVWCRWVLCFVPDPRPIVARIATALKPGGRLLIMEYYDWESWKFAPHVPEIEEFKKATLANWRADGSEPNIGLALPALLADQGLAVESAEPAVFVTHPRDFIWQWPDSFLTTHAARLVELGRLTPAQAGRIAAAWRKCTADTRTLMFTPGVLQLVARKPG